MNERCEVFEIFRRKRDAGCDEAERSDFEKHLLDCPACREQWAAETALDALFSETAPPVLSSSFNENLRRRVIEEPRTISRRPLLMKAYWLAACLVAVFFFLGWDRGGTDSDTAVMLLLFCLVFPALLMGRILRFSLFDMILGTMAHLERPVELFQNGE